MAFSFDEVNDYIICNGLGGGAAFLDLPDGDWAVSVRIKLPDNAGSVFQYFIGQGIALANPSFNWFIGEASHATTSIRNKLRFVIGDADVTDIELTGSQNVGSSTAWQLLTLIRSGNTVTQYVGATSDGSVTNSSFDAMNSTNSFYLGRNAPGDSDRFFGGMMAELAVWHRALSTTELAALNKNLAPSWFPQSLVQYVPMIRDYVNVKSGEGVFNFGTVVADHPAIIYPDPPRLFFFPEPLFTDVDSAEFGTESDKAAVTAAANSSEVAHEADLAPAIAAAANAELEFEADEAQSITEGDVASAEIAHEADSAGITAGADDAELAWEFDEVEAKTVSDVEIAHESDQALVTAGVDSPEIAWEFDEAVQRTEVQSAEIFVEAEQSHPVVEGGIKIAVDRPQAVAAHYGFGDGHWENIVKDSLQAAEFPDQERLVKTFTANYRWDSRSREFLQKDMTMEANEFGVEETVPMNFVHSHETAARVLDYLRKDEIARAGQLNFSGKKIVKAQKNQRYTVTVPSMGIASDWQVADYRTLQEAYAFRVKRYLDAKYTFDDPGDLPADESLPELTVFGDTPPFPVANFQISTYYEIKPDQSVEVYVLATWDPPEENYSETRISTRKTGETEWQEVGRGHDRALVSGFVPGTSYDVRAVPYNLAGTTPGIVSIITAVTAGADLANPTTPTGLTGTSKHGRVIFEWNRHTDPMVMGYHVRFWTSSSGGSMIVPPGMKFVRQPSDTGAKPHYEFQRQRGNLTTALSTWCEVRAVKYNGRLSAFTSRVSATTGSIMQDDITDNEITNKNRATVSSVALASIGQTIISASITKRAGTRIRIEFSMNIVSTAGSGVVTWHTELVREIGGGAASTIQDPFASTNIPLGGTAGAGGNYEDGITGTVGSVTYKIRLNFGSSGLTGKNLVLRLLELRR